MIIRDGGGWAEGCSGEALLCCITALPRAFSLFLADDKRKKGGDGFAAVSSQTIQHPSVIVRPTRRKEACKLHGKTLLVSEET